MLDKIFVCTYNHAGAQYLLSNIRDPQLSNHASGAGSGFGYFTFNYDAPDLLSDVQEIDYAFRIQVWLNAFSLLFDGEIRKIQEQTAAGKRVLAVSAAGFVSIMDDDIFDYTFTETRYTRWQSTELSPVLDMAQFWDDSAADYAYPAGDDPDMGFKRYCAAAPAGGTAPPVATLWEQTADILYLGVDSPFFMYHVDISSAGNYGAVVHEYYDGSDWVSVTPLTDTTAAFSQTGYVIFHELQMPEWARFDIKGDELYWLKITVTSVTSAAQITDFISPFVPESFNYDLDNRVYLFPSSGTPFHTNDFSYVGAQLIENRPAPPLAAADIKRVTFNYDAKLEDDWVRYCRHYNGAAFTDYDDRCYDTSAGTFTVLQDTDAALYIGSWTHFPAVWIEVDTAGVYAGLTWEYWDGTAWTSFEIELDDSARFSTDGIVWWGDLGETWARTSIDSMLAYWVRVRATGVTTAAILAHLVFHPLKIELLDATGAVLWNKTLSGTGAADIAVSNVVNFVQFKLTWTAADGDNFAGEDKLFFKATDVVLYGVDDSTVTPEAVAKKVLTVASDTGHDLDSSDASIETTSHDVSPLVFDEHQTMADVLSHVCSLVNSEILVWGIELTTVKRLFLRALGTETIVYYVRGERVEAATGGDLTASFQAVYTAYVDELERDKVLDSAQDDTVIAQLGGRFRRTLISIDRATATQAENARDLYLAENAVPRPAVSYTVKQGDVLDSAGHEVLLGEIAAGHIVCLRDYRARETIGASGDIRNSDTIFVLAAVEYAPAEQKARLVPAEDKSGFQAYLDYIARLRRE